MKRPILSRASVVVLEFLIAVEALAIIWTLTVPNIAYDWTICVGSYPFDPPKPVLHNSISQFTTLTSGWSHFKLDWTIHLGAHPYGLTENMRFGLADSETYFLPGTIRVQTNRWHLSTAQPAWFALVVLSGVSAVVTFLCDQSVRHRTYLLNKAWLN